MSRTAPHLICASARSPVIAWIRAAIEQQKGLFFLQAQTCMLGTSDYRFNSIAFISARARTISILARSLCPASTYTTAIARKTSSPLIAAREDGRVVQISSRRHCHRMWWLAGNASIARTHGSGMVFPSRAALIAFLQFQSVRWTAGVASASDACFRNSSTPFDSEYSFRSDKIARRLQQTTK